MSDALYVKAADTAGEVHHEPTNAGIRHLVKILEDEGILSAGAAAALDMLFPDYDG